MAIFFLLYSHSKYQIKRKTLFQWFTFCVKSLNFLNGVKWSITFYSNNPRKDVVAACVNHLSSAARHNAAKYAALSNHIHFKEPIIREMLIFSLSACLPLPLYIYLSFSLSPGAPTSLCMSLSFSTVRSVSNGFVFED